MEKGIKLANYAYRHVSILPMYKNQGVERMVFFKGNLFGGYRLMEETICGTREEHPGLSATRIMIGYYGLKLPVTSRYFDVTTGYTKYIIARNSEVIYLTDFAIFKEELLKKQGAGTVTWEELQGSFYSKRSLQTMDRSLNSYTVNPWQLSLLAPFFLGSSFDEGEHPNIRFY